MSWADRFRGAPNHVLQMLDQDASFAGDLFVSMQTTRGLEQIGLVTPSKQPPPNTAWNFIQAIAEQVYEAFVSTLWQSSYDTALRR